MREELTRAQTQTDLSWALELTARQPRPRYSFSTPEAFAYLPFYSGYLCLPLSLGFGVKGAVSARLGSTCLPGLQPLPSQEKSISVRNINSDQTTELTDVGSTLRHRSYSNYHQSIYLSVYLSICLSVCLSIDLSM